MEKTLVNQTGPVFSGQLGYIISPPSSAPPQGLITDGNGKRQGDKLRPPTNLNHLNWLLWTRRTSGFTPSFLQKSSSNLRRPAIQWKGLFRPLVFSSPNPSSCLS
ncbi:unnamed protein product [Pleuronectes platessa]|uniref:Uncharacterized protein n=1 Tax=Pleuronectes platessa TaxID=8262 RepID=A0A9N7YNR9_PLEPL|nr:unnamed protein product [Pleuronectes platessa]